MPLVSVHRIAVLAGTASLGLAATAFASDWVSDKQGDAGSAKLDLLAAGVDDSCQLGFAVTVWPHNGMRPEVLPAESGLLPAFQFDRNGDGRVDRLLGQPKGKAPGLYAVAGSVIGKRVAPARMTLDAMSGHLTWSVRYSQVVNGKKIRWRAVNRAAVVGALDRAPDNGFRVARWSRIGC